jgi:hypothetical protein
MTKLKLDKYARDARTWGHGAEINYAASLELFRSDNLVLWFPAASLGHHALEMGFKAALICEGLTVFNPKLVSKLDPATGLLEADCAWGHELVPLAEELAAQRKDFDLDLDLGLPPIPVLDSPNTLRDGLKIFEPFFSELRYPVEMKELKGIGREDAWILQVLFAVLRPFFRSEIGNN